MNEAIEKLKKFKAERKAYLDSLSDNHPAKTDNEGVWCPGCAKVFNYCDCGYYQAFEKEAFEAHAVTYRGIVFCFKNKKDADHFLVANDHFKYMHVRVIPNINGTF